MLDFFLMKNILEIMFFKKQFKTHLENQRENEEQRNTLTSSNP